MPSEDRINLVAGGDSAVESARFQLPLPSEVKPGPLYRLRSAVAAYATSWGIGGEKLNRLLLVANELVTNALRHGGGSGTLRLWRDGDAVYCQVSDGGAGIIDPHLAGTRLPPPDHGSGRGLWLARQFSDDLQIIKGATGTNVTARFDASAGPT